MSGAEPRERKTRKPTLKSQRPDRPAGETRDSVRLIRPRDAARLLGLSYPTLKRWIYKGKISTIKTAGGHYRIPESELDKFLFRRIDRAPVAERRMRYRSLSARNQLVGRVSAIKLLGLLAQVEISIGTSTITSVITADAVREMRLKPGDTAAALIKSTSVMIRRIDRDR